VGGVAQQLGPLEAQLQQLGGDELVVRGAAIVAALTKVFHTCSRSARCSAWARKGSTAERVLLITHFP